MLRAQDVFLYKRYISNFMKQSLYGVERWSVFEWRVGVFETASPMRFAKSIVFVCRIVVVRFRKLVVVTSFLLGRCWAEGK